MYVLRVVVLMGIKQTRCIDLGVFLNNPCFKIILERLV